ncbi:hypothetical protein [Paenibacillus sp. MBLB4367]|uniref:hypothetical protein n=1 Tax=Paenibacillus sp. MBLB4367 TaxID=3384767 RepID=UPI00390829DA
MKFSIWLTLLIVIGIITGCGEKNKIILDDVINAYCSVLQTTFEHRKEENAGVTFISLKFNNLDDTVDFENEALLMCLKEKTGVKVMIDSKDDEMEHGELHLSIQEKKIVTKQKILFKTVKMYGTGLDMTITVERKNGKWQTTEIKENKVGK